MPEPISNVNIESDKIAVFQFIIQGVKSIISSWDHIIFFGSFSLLDLFIAILAMAVIISVVISSVPNFALNSVEGYDSRVKSEKTRKQKEQNKNNSKGK